MEQAQLTDGNEGTVLGNTVKINFPSFGNRSDTGKVDTGATTSSLHATNITVNKARQTVTFQSPSLSDNLITLDLVGVQEVHSADHGGDNRPMIKLDIEIDGKPLSGATFNLNDRGNMDARILVGQNVLKAGKFVIDPSKDQQPDATPINSGETPNTDRVIAGQRDHQHEALIMQAVEVLVENNISLADLLRYMQTAAVNRIVE